MLPEHEILIDFLNNRFDDSDLAGLNPVNWSTIVSEAGRHRIAPLLYSKINQAKAEEVIPEEVLQKFREKYLATAYRNTLLFHQLTVLVEELNHKEIPVILLKGAHLAEFVYKDIALRPMSDLDIMVKEEHLSAVVQVAFSSGFQFLGDQNPEKGKSNHNYDYGIMPDFKHYHALIHPETKCLLEIHCFISSENSVFEIPVSEMWESAESAILNKKEIYLLSPEDLVIYLCLHAAYDHLFDFGLGAIYDIAIVIKHYDKNINWKEIQRRSAKWRTNQSLLLTLYFTKKWMNVDIPDAMLENFRLDKMVEIAEERILKTIENVPLHQHYLNWRNQRNMFNKIRYILNVLFPSRKFMASRYLKPNNSKILLGSYVFRFFQAFKILWEIMKSFLLDDSRHHSRLKRGDNDILLREWLIKS